jgi:hypothetical protein
MELHHFHIHQTRPGSEGHGQAVGGLLGRGRHDLVHCRAGSGREQRGFGAHHQKGPPTHIDAEGSRHTVAVGSVQELDAAMILQVRDLVTEHLLHQPRHDLDAGEVATMHGAVEGLPGEGFLMDRPIGVAIEETPQAIFQPANAVGGGFDQRPGELLVVEAGAALDGILEVLGQRVGRV